MDYVEWLQAKELYRSVVFMCDKYTPWVDKLRGTPYKLSDILRFDMAAFVLYLCAYDEQKCMEGMAFYRVLTGLGRDDMGAFLNCMKSRPKPAVDFETEPPTVIKLLKDTQEKASYGAFSSNTYATMKCVISLFATMGQILLADRAEGAPLPPRDLNVILRTMENRVSAHSVT